MIRAFPLFPPWQLFVLSLLSFCFIWEGGEGLRVVNEGITLHRLLSTLSSSLFLVLPKWEGGERLVYSLFKKSIQKHTLLTIPASKCSLCLPEAKLTCSRNQFGGSRWPSFFLFHFLLASRWSNAAGDVFRFQFGISHCVPESRVIFLLRFPHSARLIISQHNLCFTDW